MNCQRWSLTERSRPATTLAVNSVSVTSTTFAATTWPIRESPRCLVGGSSSRMGSAPHIGRSRLYENVRRSFHAMASTAGSGIYATGRPSGAPRLLFVSAAAILSEAMASGAEIIRRAKEQITEVDPKEVHDLLDNRNGEVIVDVREQTEFEESHIPGAVHVPRGHLESAHRGRRQGQGPARGPLLRRRATAPRSPPRPSRRSSATRTSSR